MADDAAGVLTVVVVNALPSAFFPASGAGAFQAQQAFLKGVYAPDQHNMSLHGLIANLLDVTEHTGTPTFNQGERLAHALDIGVVVLAVALVLIAAGARILRRRMGRRGEQDAALWLALAALMAPEVLSAPLVWPAESLVVPLAGLALLAYAVSTPADETRWRAAMTLLALLGVLLGVAAALGGVAWRDLPQGEPVRALYVLPALAALAIYAATLVGLAGIILGAIRASTSARAMTAQHQPGNAKQ